jgi:hypothetical protein
MRSWQSDYRRGLRFLSSHRLPGAVEALRGAADLCPASARADLARILYYLGLALERSGHSSLAVKSWVSARRLSRRGTIAQAYARWVNEYGMRRMPTPEGDDYCAFKAAQTARYLSKRGSGKFGSRAERDAVTDLIGVSWATLRSSGVLRGLSPARKLELFKRAKVDLPFLYAEDAFDSGDEPLVGNFRRGSLGKARVTADDRCPCGSGLPFRRCCGRQASCVEIEYGRPEGRPSGSH